MDFSIYQYILAFLGSFLAGMINTLAGNGSVITLTILTDLLRLDAGVANATNRVGVLFQSLGSATGFVKNNMFQTEKNWVIIISCVFGAVAGVWTVVNTSNEDLDVYKRQVYWGGQKDSATHLLYLQHHQQDSGQVPENRLKDF